MVFHAGDATAGLYAPSRIPECALEGAQFEISSIGVDWPIESFLPSDTRHGQKEFAYCRDGAGHCDLYRYCDLDRPSADCSLSLIVFVSCGRPVLSVRLHQSLIDLRAVAVPPLPESCSAGRFDSRQTVREETRLKINCIAVYQKQHVTFGHNRGNTNQSEDRL